MFTARADVPRVAAEKDRDVSTLSRQKSHSPHSPGRLGWRHPNPKGLLQPLLLEVKASAKSFLLPCTGTSCLENRGNALAYHLRGKDAAETLHYYCYHAKSWGSEEGRKCVYDMKFILVVHKNPGYF